MAKSSEILNPHALLSLGMVSGQNNINLFVVNYIEDINDKNAPPEIVVDIIDLEANAIKAKVTGGEKLLQVDGGADAFTNAEVGIFELRIDPKSIVSIPGGISFSYVGGGGGSCGLGQIVKMGYDSTDGSVVLGIVDIESIGGGHHKHHKHHKH